MAARQVGLGVCIRKNWTPEGETGKLTLLSRSKLGASLQSNKPIRTKPSRSRRRPKDGQGNDKESTTGSRIVMR
jgi:hypothetical protein